MMASADDGLPSCPIPLHEYPNVLLAHGGGGSLMKDLIDKVFRRTFRSGNDELDHDAAELVLDSPRLAFTTDSFVVRPLFFPGGDIGSLAVHGTVNDLAMSGARPVALSAGFILEEGLSMDVLRRVTQSMQNAARDARVRICTGDTKVVERGRGDGIYINTAGIGVISEGVRVRPSRIKPGDAVVISGDVGRHGVAVMAKREGLEFETEIQSDSAPLHGLVAMLIKSSVDIHCMRDLTRGGLASAANELAISAGVEIHLMERAIPVSDEVQAACELLGLDPLYVACEGRCVCFVSADDAERTLSQLRSHPAGSNAAVIGKVRETTRPLVSMQNRIGTARILDLLSGEQLPRIC